MLIAYKESIGLKTFSLGEKYINKIKINLLKFRHHYKQKPTVHFKD